MASFHLAVLMALACWINAETVFPRPNKEESTIDYWMKLGRNELEEALIKPKLTNIAKNVILFLGDGMGVTVTTAGRIFKGQKQGQSGEEGYLVWERFPNMGLMKTYNLDRQVPDSSATSTAFLSGVKANLFTLGVSGEVKLNDCKASLKEENRVRSVLEWAQDAGKDTGVVTTTQVTHGTPAGLYAKSASRLWQCDTKMLKHGTDVQGCKDIARQLVEDKPGSTMKVIMGGGRQEMGAPETEGEKNKCMRSDGKNLVEEWKKDKKARSEKYAYVTTAGQLHSIDVDNTDYIMGLFGDLHLPFEVDRRNSSADGAPHIKEMVEVAIKRLQRSDNGFFLLVEGGRIDHGLHMGEPRRALEEVLAMEEAVKVALKMIDIEETLLIVTADHSHVMTINGYPERGNNILGLVRPEFFVSDGLPYTTLMFTNGPGFNYTWDGGKVVRQNLTGVDTSDKNFRPQAGVPTIEKYETHAGEDVASFAIGPMSHLFHRVHEQTHVAHVMGYAACIGPYKGCHRPTVSIPYHLCNPTSHPKMDASVQLDSSVNTASSLGILVMALMNVILGFFVV